MKYIAPKTVLCIHDLSGAGRCSMGAAAPVLAHRLMLSSTARIKRGAAESIIADILDRVPVPTERGLGYWQAK